MHPPERSKRTFSSQEPDAGKSGNSFQNPNLSCWAGEFCFLFPHLCFSCVFSTFTHNMQNLVSYTKALLGCTTAFSVAPGWYSTKCPVLFPLFIMSLLAMGQIQTRKLPDLGSFFYSGCPSVHACHWGTIRRLLLGCRIQNGMSYKAKQSRELNAYI